MNETDKPILGFVGAGKAGSTLARLWHRAGYTIGAIHSRTWASVERLALQTDSVGLLSAGEVIERCDLIFLTVPDDAIDEVSSIIYNFSWKGKAVVHTSGVHDRHVFDTLEMRGAMTGSLHPAFPFADIETSVANLPGATFAIESNHPILLGWLQLLVRVLDGHNILIPSGSKALYHAALVMTSNYSVSLYAAAEQLLIGLGAERNSADNALNRLIDATVENLKTQGIPNALTGPLIRGDVGTIERHLKSLRMVDTKLADLYRNLARLSYPMLDQRGVAVDNIEEILKQDEQYAADHT